MNSSQLIFIGTVFFFLFIFFSGFWLSRSGKPYSTLIFTIHKLIGLATGIFLVVTIFRIHRITPLNPVQIAAIGISVLLFVITVAAGGLLSVEKPMPLAVAIIHKVLPYLIALSTSGSLYLLFT